MVVTQHRGDPLVVRVMGINQMQQRRLRQLHARRIEKLWQGRLLNAQRGLTPDHLNRRLQAFPAQCGAQNVVAFDHPLQGLAKSVQTRRVGERELRLQQVGIAVPGCQVVIKNTGLQGAQRIDILHIGSPARYLRDDAVNGRLIQRYQRQQFGGDVLAVRIDQVGRHLDFAVATNCLSQRGQRWLNEKNANVRPHVQTAHARNQGHGEQRMTAQFKEIILPTDLLYLQQLRPEAGEGDFDRAVRRFISPAGEAVTIRCWQAFAVQFAVRRYRQAGKPDKGRRHHVIRQQPRQPGAQLLDIQPGLAFSAGVIAHQTLVSGHILARHDHSVENLWMIIQARRDLTQLDTETANLDLLVVTAQVFQAAVGHPARQVTGPVNARICGVAERVIEEPFGGQCFTVQVAACHSGTTDIQLADHTERHRLAAGVEDIQLQIGNALADRAGADTLGVFGLHRVIGHVHGGFGDAVHVDQLGGGVHVAGVPRLEHRCFQRFTAENHLAQRMLLRILALGSNQLAKRTRRLVEHRHPGAAQQRVEVFRRAADQLRHDQQTPAVQQRAPDFPDREVEGKRVEQRPDVLFVETEPVFGGREQPRNIAVFDHHPLGQAGGAGGVDHIRQARGLDRHLRITLGFVLQTGIVEADHRHLRHRQGGLH
ncbi:Uncharacterized protein AC506_2553 [Pseudomonas syringae pv. maculicola str. M6]|nr:Uncharacterized protein AC506_2553 [Pseudomonas syringae pv. maculicola str. M6]